MSLKCRPAEHCPRLPPIIPAPNAGPTVGLSVLSVISKIVSWGRKRKLRLKQACGVSKLEQAMRPNVTGECP